MKVFIVLTMLCVFVGCGGSNHGPKPTIHPAKDTSDSASIYAACSDSSPRIIAPHTEQDGYGSRTNYYIVVCSDGSVHQVPSS